MQVPGVTLSKEMPDVAKSLAEFLIGVNSGARDSNVLFLQVVTPCKITSFGTCQTSAAVTTVWLGTPAWDAWKDQLKP